MQATHVFKLLSGVECEVKELKGKHQKMLTTKGVNVQEAMDKIISDVCVRVGSNHNVSPQFVKEMLTGDRNMVLFMARQFSMEFEEKYAFPIKYKRDGKNVTDEVVVDLSEVTFKPYAFQVADYSEVQKEYTIELPKVGKVKFTLSDGIGEQYVGGMSKRDISSHIDLLARRPVYFTNDTWVRLNLDDLGMKTIETLRKTIYDVEGKIECDFDIENPDPNADEKRIRFNLLSDPNFLFPSGVFS